MKPTAVLEKTDPIIPYQISFFDTMEDLKSYLINRPGEDEYKDETVFIDDKSI